MWQKGLVATRTVSSEFQVYFWLMPFQPFNRHNNRTTVGATTWIITIKVAILWILDWLLFLRNCSNTKFMEIVGFRIIICKDLICVKFIGKNPAGLEPLHGFQVTSPCDLHNLLLLLSRLPVRHWRAYTEGKTCNYIT